MRSRLLRLKLWVLCASETTLIAPAFELPGAWRSSGGLSTSFYSGTIRHIVPQQRSTLISLPASYPFGSQP